MSHSFHTTGSGLTVNFQLDEDTTTKPCPICERIELDGVVKVTAALDRQSGITPATCTSGHLVLVSWTRGVADTTDG